MPVYKVEDWIVIKGMVPKVKRCWRELVFSSTSRNKLKRAAKWMESMFPGGYRADEISFKKTMMEKKKESLVVVLRSPHVNKTSKDEMVVYRYKRILWREFPLNEKKKYISRAEHFDSFGRGGLEYTLYEGK